jgi:tRNA 2-thiouridine synthesizing protein A
MSQHTLDARNSLCPMPVIKTQNKIAELQAGDILEVTCTDPGALNDIPAWCRINGHLVKETFENNDEVIIIIQVNGQASV